MKYACSGTDYHKWDLYEKKILSDISEVEFVAGFDPPNPLWRGGPAGSNYKQTTNKDQTNRIVRSSNNKQTTKTLEQTNSKQQTKMIVCSL